MAEAGWRVRLVSPHTYRCHHPRKRMIQYAAASRFNSTAPRSTGSPAFAGDDIIVKRTVMRHALQQPRLFLFRLFDQFLADRQRAARNEENHGRGAGDG